MLIPNKDSIFYFSVSNNPSKRGSEFYNKLFFKKKKNCIYLPLQIKTILDFKKFIKFLKSDIIKVGGISVSMPLKSIAQKYANVNHHSSLITKNANTLIFKKKKILAYNTDYLAAKKILSKRKFDNFIILTEKEVQLLELFLKNKNPMSKNKILSSVWNYSPDADTHTVETHIYRLRKKIKDTSSCGGPYFGIMPPLKGNKKLN